MTTRKDMQWIRCQICDGAYRVDVSEGDMYALECSATCTAIYAERWLTPDREPVATVKTAADEDHGPDVCPTDNPPVEAICEFHPEGLAIDAPLFINGRIVR
jgi:hypothetical protein